LISEIIVYRSADQQSWSEVGTFNMEDYPAMIGTYACSLAECATYDNKISENCFMAYATFYAKNSRGIGRRGAIRTIYIILKRSFVKCQKEFYFKAIQ